MNISVISASVIGLSGSFTPWLLLAIFLITMAAQFGLFIPYLLESIWLFSGYNVILGIIPPLFLVALCVVGVVGRELGSGAFFYASSAGSQPLQKFYHKHVEPRLTSCAPGQVRPGLIKRFLGRVANSVFGTGEAGQTLELFGRPLRFSPFTVALGHFLWMRVPIIMTMGLKGKMKPLLLGVALFSILFDGAYILMGVLGGAEGVNRTMMLVYPLALMTVIFATTYGLRRLSRQIASRQ